MTPGDYKDVALSVSIAIFALRWAFGTIGEHRKSDDKRGTKAEELIASQLTAATKHSRDDYLRIEREVEKNYSKLDAKLDALHAKITLIELTATKLMSELSHANDRDLNFHDRAWPAHLSHVRHIEFEVNKNRESINEVRSRLDMPTTSQTPPQGVPVAVTPEGGGSGGYIVAPLDVIKRRPQKG